MRQHLAALLIAVPLSIVGPHPSLRLPRSVLAPVPDHDQHQDAATPPLRFVPPGTPLPSTAACAVRVRAGRPDSDIERRPGNARANRAPGARIAGISGARGSLAAAFAGRVDGAFAGTTDVIIQWAACKWGIEVDVVRAMAFQESGWHQDVVGPKGTVGLLQIKPSAHPNTLPAARTSTAFNLDYGLAWWRTCYEGGFAWVPASARGDAWGCVGLWYAGQWRTEAALGYMALVMRHVVEHPWLRRSF